MIESVRATFDNSTYAYIVCVRSSKTFRFVCFLILDLKLMIEGKKRISKEIIIECFCIVLLIVMYYYFALINLNVNGVLMCGFSIENRTKDKKRRKKEKKVLFLAIV